MHYLLGEQTAAGKIYLDELNRNGSNLSRETLLNSLHMTYGYDGGAELWPTWTNTSTRRNTRLSPFNWPPTRGGRGSWYSRRFGRPANTSQTYRRIKDLLASHRDLLRSNAGADTLALLGMRTALRMGDPSAAREIAESVPVGAAARASPDFQWMSASALFLSREYAAAEQPLLDCSTRSVPAEVNGRQPRTGCAGSTGKPATWPGNFGSRCGCTRPTSGVSTWPLPADCPISLCIRRLPGWDLGQLLEAGAPVDALRAFAEQNPELPDIRLVQYALAVRLAREERYRESAELYRSIHAYRRAQRMQQLADLSHAVDRLGISLEQSWRLATRWPRSSRRTLTGSISTTPSGMECSAMLCARIGTAG